jgi:hypothetical protein
MDRSIKFFPRRVDIDIMKKLTLLMMISTVGIVLSAQEYTIQTISAQKEGSITPAFEKKVQKSALPVEKRKEGKCTTLTVGKYPSAKAAHRDLKKVKGIAKDAFVRPSERSVPQSCATQTAAQTPKKESVETKSVAVVEPKTATAKPIEPKAVEVKAAVSSAPLVTAHKEEPLKGQDVQKPAVSAVPTTVKNETAAIVNSLKSEPCKSAPCEKVSSAVYVYDRNIARKSDLHDAIEYYKNSPYHSFKPSYSQR